MLPEPVSPTAGPAPAAAMKPPPLTPYRGSAPPVSASGHSATGASQGGVATAGGFRGPSPPLWDQALEQEKRLRSELRKKSFWDPDVRRLRSALQGTYEALLFGHFEFSCAHEVEPCLWKAVFYKPIEEFRSRVRALEGLAKGAAAAVQASAAVAAAGGAGAAAVQLATPEEARRQLARTTSAYLRFLDDALAFYRKTVWKLQWVYGNVGATVDLDAALQNEIQECVPRATGARVPDARPSVHRCLIYLGDLCRYQSMALKERPTSARPLWERAMSYYRQAARVLPASGNPYNQMAVMSYYTNDELRAVYYYFRSLAVAMPFVTARENLLLLFEKNRSKYGNIAAAHASAALQGCHDADARAAAGHIADVSTRFVRLHGLLFDRINLDTLPDVLTAATRDLETMLGHTGCRALLQKANESDQILFHLAIMSVFTVHNVSAPPSGAAAGGYAAAAQRASDRCHALAVALRFAAAVAGCTAGMAEAAAAGGGVGDVDMGFGAVSASCHVMLAWMVSNPHVLTAEPAAATATAAAAAAGGGLGCEAPEVAAEVAARAAFLAAAARLAAHLSDLTRRRAQDQDWQDPAVRHRSLPEDSELVGFGPLAPVVSTASTWPAASEAPGGAAVLAVRVARMLQALRHLDDALELPRGAAAGQSVDPQAAAAVVRELTRAVHSFKTAVAQAITAPQHGLPAGSALHSPFNGLAVAGAHVGFGAAGIGGPGPAPHGPAHPHLHPHQHLQQQQQNGLGQAQPHPLPHVGRAGGQHPHPQHAGQLNAFAQRHFQQQQPAAVGNGAGPVGHAGNAGHPPESQPPRQQPPRSPVAQQLFGPSRGQGLSNEGQRGSGGSGGGVGSGDSAQRAIGAPPPTFGPPGSASGQHSPPPPLPLPRTLNGAGGTARGVGGGGVATAAGLDIGAAGAGSEAVDQPPTPFGGAAAAAAAPSQARANNGAPTAAGAVNKGGDSAAACGAPSRGAAADGDDDAAEDEIVYQPPKPGSAMVRPPSVQSGLQYLHRRSSSGGGVSQDPRGILSKQPSAGGSSAAHLHSREPSRDGSTVLLRSPSVLSTGGDSNVPGGGPVAMPAMGPGLMVNCAVGAAGGRLSGSGLTSPSSAYGSTVPPSPHNLIWETFGSVHGSGGAGGAGGGGGGSGTGMLPPPTSGAVAATAPGGYPARPPSPAVGDLPGAGTIGLLQNLLHGGGTGAVGAASGSPIAGGTSAALPPGARRLSAGTGVAAAAAGGASAAVPGPAGGSVTAITTSPGGNAGVLSVFAGTGSRPGSSGAAGGGGGSGPHASGLPTGLGPRRAMTAAGGGVTAAAPGEQLAGQGLRVAGPGPGPGSGVGSGAAQVLQLDSLGQGPQLVVAADALTAPFAGLPVSLQQRAQPAVHPPQPRGGAAPLLLTTGSQSAPHAGAAGSAAAVAVPLGGATGGLGHNGGPAGLPAQSRGLLPFGGGGVAGAASAFGLPAPLPAPHLHSGAGALAAAAGAGAGVSSGGSGGGHQHLAWPPSATAAPAAGGGSMAGLDMSYFATAAGNYQAAALAEATAEATAVAMADDVLQAMDADDDGFAPNGAATAGGPTSAFAADAAGTGMYGGGTEDLMDIEHFSPAVAAAAAGGGGAAAPGPVTREPSATSEGLFNSGGYAGGGGFAGRSSGSGSGHGFATMLAAAGVSGLRRSAEALGAGGAAASAAAALGSIEGFGSWGVVQVLPERLTEYHHRLRWEGHAGGGAGGFGGGAGVSGGPGESGAGALFSGGGANGNRPEGVAPAAAAAATAAALPPPPQPHLQQPPHLQPWGGQHPNPDARAGQRPTTNAAIGGGAAAGGSGGPGGAGGVFGEDLSCLAFLAAQLHAPDPTAGPGAGGGQVASRMATAAAADAQG